LAGQKVPGVSWPQFDITTGQIAARGRTFC